LVAGGVAAVGFEHIPADQSFSGKKGAKAVKRTKIKVISNPA